MYLIKEQTVRNVLYFYLTKYSPIYVQHSLVKAKIFGESRFSATLAFTVHSKQWKHRTVSEICSNAKIKNNIGIGLVFLLLILNRFHTLLSCLHCREVISLEVQVIFQYLSSASVIGCINQDSDFDCRMDFDRRSERMYF